VLSRSSDLDCNDPSNAAMHTALFGAAIVTSNSQKIRFFRRHIPSFECKPGCHDCCGPVTTSTEEMARLPVKSDKDHEVALADLSCPHLGDTGCQVYAERPLICRLFGTTPRLACPNGKRPEVMIDPRIEQQIYRYFVETRHVLI
jgi:hypothetical protein